MTHSTARNHDGFYFRGGIGAALGSFDAANFQQGTGRLGAAELAIGGTVGGGLALGGGIYGVTGNFKSDGDFSETGATGALWMLAMFGDWYIDPRLGFHVQAGVGLADLRFDLQGPRPGYSGNGLGFMLGAGYEAFVSNELSIGALVRYQYAAGTAENMDDANETHDVTFAAPALLFTLTVH